MELLIVLALIILIFIILLINIRTQIARGHDIKRKADLHNVQKAFEEYANDKACFPLADALANCGSADLAPYIAQVPCDPVGKNNTYLYVVGDPNACTEYHLCAKLEDLTDPDIKRLGCDPIQGCGWGAGYNYCVAEGASVVAPGFVPGALPGGGGVGGGGGMPTPTATPIPGMWACTRAGDCNGYSDPVGAGCPVTYQTRCVYNGIYQCGNPLNRCKNY